MMMPREVSTSLATKYVTSVNTVHTWPYESSNGVTADDLPRNGSIAFLLHPFLAVGWEGTRIKC